MTSIFKYCNDVSKGRNFADDVPWAMQLYLLDLYWKYQHTTLQIVHKSAFLAGMETGQGPHFSRALLVCMLASGARASASPKLRAMAVKAADDHSEERPFLMREAEEALEAELSNPGITTVQSLMLLSIMDCSESNDSKGWMRSGLVSTVVLF